MHPVGPGLMNVQSKFCVLPLLDKFAYLRAYDRPRFNECAVEVLGVALVDQMWFLMCK